MNSKPPTPISYAFEALVQEWNGDCLALTSSEIYLFNKLCARVHKTKKIDKETEDFVRMIQSQNRFVQRYEEEA